MDKKSAAKAKTMPAWISDWFAKGISDDLRAWARGKGIEPFLDLHFEKFRDYMAQARSWTRYTDLDAAFRTCARDDWGEVRKRAQMDAQFGRGVDLNSWWKSADGVKAKGFAIGIPWNPAAYRAKAIEWYEKRGPATEQQVASAAWRMFEIEVLDTVVDREGWGAWVDRERRSAEFDAVCRRRQARGATYPATEGEATNAR